MTTILKGIGLVIAGVVIGYFASWMMSGHKVGGVYEQVASYFYQGLYAGTSNQFSVDASGNVTTSAAVSANGLVRMDGGQLYSNPLSTTTMGATETLQLSDVNTYDTIILMPNVAGNTTLTLFASSTASTWLPNAGDIQKTCFINGTTTAATSYIFAGGTGTTLLVASSSASALGSLRIAPQKEGCFVFTRANATATTNDILSSFTAYQ
jgi:hypothetical protein